MLRHRLWSGGVEFGKSLTELTVRAGAKILISLLHFLPKGHSAAEFPIEEVQVCSRVLLAVFEGKEQRK